MRCAKCDFENPFDARVCVNCGVNLRLPDALAETRALEIENDPFLGKTISGKYQVTQMIKQGGMGTVYEARDNTLNRTVALKFLSSRLTGDAEARKQFIREAQAASALDHPNICTIYEVDETEERQIFISMAYYHGQTVREKLAEGTLGFEEMLYTVIHVARGLDKAHNAGIVHRDIKPDNIFITDDRQVKILDFGLAKLSAESGKVSTAPAGTVLYMSPEQIQGKKTDRRTDIWSLGVVIYEMLTGKPPFTGHDIGEVMNSIVNAEPESARRIRSDLPIGFEPVMNKALQKSPEARYQTAASLLADLDQIRRDVETRKQDSKSSIAVMPLLDMSPRKDQEYFCEGIAEELINSLAKIRSLHVASRTSSFKYKDSDLDIREIGRRLNVDTVLEGSVRKAGDRLRITAQLINVADGYHLWSERYDREMKDVFIIQDEIARSIVLALQVKLTPEERRSIQAPTTTDIQAYDYYLRGRKFYYQFTRKTVELALQMFTLAIKHDPKYALAYTGIADCCTYLFLYAERSEESLKRANEASRRALSLNPESAQAHASRGQVLSLSKKHREAEVEFEAATRLGPRLFEAYYFYARDCFAQGKFEKAIELYEKSSEINPEDYQSLLLVAPIHDHMGQKAKGDDARRRGIKVVEEHLKLNPGEVRALYMGANGLVSLGETEKGLEWAGLALIMDQADPMVLYNVGAIYSVAGQAEKALDCLEKAARAGLSQREWYEHDSDLDPLRNHPRFKALLHHLR